MEKMKQSGVLETSTNPLSIGPGVGRRGFLGWAASAALPLVAGKTLVSLSACGGGTRSADIDARQFTDIPNAASATSVTVSAQARKVQWAQGVNPDAVNAWVYVPSTSTAAAAAVLSNHFGPTFNVRRGTPTQVTWKNEIPEDSGNPGHLVQPPLAYTLPDGAQCGAVTLQSRVGLSTHLHGLRVAGTSDGWPLQVMSFPGNTYTSPGVTGNFPTQVAFEYPNDQRSAMLWYHDHALDHTASHVHAGLAGLYFIRDQADDDLVTLIGGPTQEFPMVLQDRILKADKKSIDYPAGMPNTPDLSRPEFLGTTLFVNGHPAVTYTVTRRTWRVRLLNASNTRTYALTLCNPAAIAAKSGQAWYGNCLRLVGGDGGLFARSVALGQTDVILLAPGQRRDVLVDLSGVPASVQSLRLVNLNLLPHLEENAITPEAIYTTFGGSVLLPTDPRVEAWINDPLCRVVDVNVDPTAVTSVAAGGAVSPSAAQIDAILGGVATDDDFDWNGSRYVPKGTAPKFGPNRLILLVSNTEGRADTDPPVNGVDGWGDVQIFEMGSSPSADGTWSLPFDVDLVKTDGPSAGAPGAVPPYAIRRRSWFASRTNPDITATKSYPALHGQPMQATTGTYERWYVANIGNSQPLVANDALPDMHPFHVHLVNFVVTKRWNLVTTVNPDSSTTSTFVETTADDGVNIDTVSRQDTVLIPSNQIVELLLYFPPNYTGKYAFHCHLLEHEDMCMMSHFEVNDPPAPATPV